MQLGGPAPSEMPKGAGGVLFQVREAHLDAFPLVSRLDERRRSHQPACHVAGILVEVARDLARRLLGAAPHLQRADVAVTL